MTTAFAPRFIKTTPLSGAQPGNIFLEKPRQEIDSHGCFQFPQIPKIHDGFLTV